MQREHTHVQKFLLNSKIRETLTSGAFLFFSRKLEFNLAGKLAFVKSQCH